MQEIWKRTGRPGRAGNIDLRRKDRRLRHRQPLYLALLLLALAFLAGCGQSSVGFTGPASLPVIKEPVNPVVPVALSTFHLYNGTLPAPPPTITANEAYLLNPATDTVYLASNADEEVAMASTTKIMTAYVALTFGQLDQPITVGPDANGATLQKEYGASVAGLHTGDVLSLHDLLYGLLLPSGDDAAVAIADGIAGSQQNFVALMNLEAGLLGLRHTHYSDVHGLDAPGHHTTARDLGRLAAVAMENPTFATIVRTITYTVPATADHAKYTWQTTNNLLTPLDYPGTIGIKTGFTGEAGGCLVFAVKSSHGELIGVILGEQVENNRFTDAIALLNWGFTIEAQQSGQAPTTATPTATSSPTPTPAA